MWRSRVAFTYLKVKSAKCLCLIPVVLVLGIWSCLHHRPIHDTSLRRCRYSTHCQGLSQFYLHTCVSSASGMSHLPLSSHSQSQLVQTSCTSLYRTGDWTCLVDYEQLDQLHGQIWIRHSTTYGSSHWEFVTYAFKTRKNSQILRNLKNSLRFLQVRFITSLVFEFAQHRCLNFIKLKKLAGF